MRQDVFCCWHESDGSETSHLQNISELKYTFRLTVLVSQHTVGLQTPSVHSDTNYFANFKLSL